MRLSYCDVFYYIDTKETENKRRGISSGGERRGRMFGTM